MKRYKQSNTSYRQQLESPLQKTGIHLRTGKDGRQQSRVTGKTQSPGKAE